MPKIEVNREILFKQIGKNLKTDELISLLESAKAELDEVDETNGILKIELNDTNRPDLWSTRGLARQLASYQGKKPQVYDFFNKPTALIKKVVLVEKRLEKIRPFIAAFVASGPAITEPALIDLIQSQEKLCQNFGCKRKTIAMGVYRADIIKYPIQYLAADPDKTSFIPLGMDKELSLCQILKEHPKGIEFASLVKDFPLYPFLQDSSGEVLSFPPIINSQKLGAVEIGDNNLFVELTGTDLDNLLLACSIVACDLADAGYKIEPLLIKYPYDTPYGKEIVTPYYFQKPIEVELTYIERLLGEKIQAKEACSYLEKMGNQAETCADKIKLIPPAFRNDFLHQVDLVEEIVIGKGLASFQPILPKDFTAGRLTAEELFARQIRDIMVGLGFQEMIYNYLGSKQDFVEKMELTGEDIIQIANPMSENYELVRNSILPNLLMSEALSANAVYPHKIFECGKIARKDPTENYGSRTINSLGILIAERTANFNEINAIISALMFYTSRSYSLKPLIDQRFIAGRAAEIWWQNKKIGFFGEVHPKILENWKIEMPICAAEIDLDLLQDI